MWKDSLNQGDKLVKNVNKQGVDPVASSSNNHNLRTRSKVDYKVLSHKGKIVNLSFLRNFVEFFD